MGERDVLNEGEMALLDLVEADIRRTDEGPGGSKLLTRDIVQLAGIARRLVSEVERLRAESEAAFACIECDGEGAVDEDGCCVTCGADCFVLRGTPDERASTRDLIDTVVSAARCAAAGDVERLRARNEALEKVAMKARPLALKGFARPRIEFIGAEFRGLYDALAALDLLDAKAALAEPGKGGAT